MSIVMERDVTISTDGRIELNALEALAGAKAHVVVMLGDPSPDRPQMAELLDNFSDSSIYPPYTLGVPQ
jgi:hypothetical protein